jgi:hypothetical protein
VPDFQTNSRRSLLHPNNLPTSEISMEVGVMSRVRTILLSLSYLASVCFPPSAQAAARETGARLASPQEGEAIVQAAWQLRRGLFPKPDCSHFVHAIYAQAGFLYTYAASRAVFAGIEGFRRVTRPQSGDVIVWQGHIGIVIDPKEHSFYSSVTAGFAIQSYQSRYWTGRGNPRFYRVLVDVEQSPPPLLASLALHTPARAQVLSSLMQSLLAQPPVLMHSEAPQMLAQSNNSESPALKDDTAQVRMAQAEEERVIHSIIEDRPVQTEVIAAATNDTHISDQVLVTSRPALAKKDVLAALRRSVDTNGERLLQTGSFDSQPSVSVVDSLKIVAINVQGNTGFADLEVKQMGTFEYGKAIPARTTARLHVILSRKEQGWVLAMPQDLICLNRDLAVMAITDHLTSVPHDSQELKVSRRLLSELLPERKLWRPRTWFRLSRSSRKVPSSPHDISA